MLREEIEKNLLNLKRKKKTYLDQYGLTCQTNNLGYEIRIIP
jgi:hypothetical protein